MTDRMQYTTLLICTGNKLAAQLQINYRKMFLFKLQPGMLGLGLGLKANFLGLGLGGHGLDLEDFGLGLATLA